MTINLIRLASFISVAVLAIVLNGTVRGQSQQSTHPTDKARAGAFRVHGGFANLIQGDVQCDCNGGPIKSLPATHKFKSGDTVQVGDDGRLEILLEPGYYLRLFSNTQVRLVDLSPANLKIKVLRGAAIFEIAINEWPNLFRRQEQFKDLIYEMVSVVTPRDEFVIIRGGAYRFNVSPAGVSEVKVQKGLAVIAGSRVTDGMTASVVNDRVEVAPDKKVADAFDNWSRERATSLIKANQALKKESWYKHVRETVEVEDRDDTSKTRELHTLVARNGVVAFVENAAFLRPGESAWQALKAGDVLVSGEKVRTARETRAELDPYPEFYFCLGSNTEIAYSEREGQVSVTIVSGSVVIIADPDPKTQDRNSLTLVAGNAAYEIANKGAYRLDVSPGKSELLIYEGAVKVAGQNVSAPRRISHGPAGDTVLALDKLSQDSFDVWSKRRSERLQVAFIRRLLLPSFGLWFREQSTDQYTFVPGLWNYRSPYGGRYAIKYGYDTQPRPFFPLDPPLPRSPTRP